MEYIKTIKNEAEMLGFAAQLAPLVPLGSVIFLSGNLGAGKTTFTRGFLHALGHAGKVKSPTYTLVEPYEFSDKTIYHFDLYRLTSPESLLHMGVQDYFHAHAICILEWPDKGDPILPKPDLVCQIDFLEEGRRVQLLAHSVIGERIIQQLTC